MVLGDEPFGSYLGRERGDLMNGISILIRRDPRERTSLDHVRIPQESGPPQTRRGDLSRQWICRCFELGLQPQELGKLVLLKRSCPSLPVRVAQADRHLLPTLRWADAQRVLLKGRIPHTNILPGAGI